MTKTHNIQRIILIAFIAVYALLSLKVMLVFMPASAYGTDMHMDRKLEGMQSPPYSYRMLVPFVSDGIVALIPGAIKNDVTPKLIALREGAFVKKWIELDQRVLDPAIADDKIFETLINMLVVYATLIAFVWMLYVLAASLFPGSMIYRLAAPVFALLLICPFAQVYAYSYDFAELFFSCACFYLLFKKSWRPYFLCLFFATLNKETGLFAILFYFIWFYKKLPQAQYIKLGALQILLYFVTEGAILYHYTSAYLMSSISPHPGEPGTAWEWFMVSVNFLTDGFLGLLQQRPRLYSNRIIFLLSHDYSTFVQMIVAAVLVSYRWLEKPAMLRAGLWMVLMNAVAFVLFCNTSEYRDLYWCMPVLILLAVHTLVNMSGVENIPLLRADTKKA